MSEHASSQQARPSPPAGPYLVAGAGVAGRAAARALAEHAGVGEVTVWDEIVSQDTRAAARELEGLGVAVRLGRNVTGADLPRPGCLVKSPGIPMDSAPGQLALSAGATVIDELELGWRLGRRPLLAVTGTNGKSTTCSLLSAALGGAEVAGNSEFHPGLCAVSPQGPPLVCEVSSYQLEACPELLPELALLTNLTRDHLHRHGSMERYGRTKRRLFVRGRRAVPAAAIGIDQPFGAKLAGELERRGSRVARVGRAREADYRLTGCALEGHGWLMRARTPHGPLALRPRVAGRHGALNLLSALAAAALAGTDPERAAGLLEAAPPVPGRFEMVHAGQPFDVIVDFAHNEHGVREALGAARSLAAREGGRLLAVVGTVGTHDPGKRPATGRAAAELADRVVFAPISLYGDTPERPLEGLERGARRVPGAVYRSIPDRREGIAAALGEARAGDVVVLTGRGARGRLVIGSDGSGPPFDDRVVVRELLEELGYGRVRRRRSASSGRASAEPIR